MAFVSLMYGVLFWIATLVLVIGVGRKIHGYSKIPAPLKIPTTPAPITQRGVVWRMFREVVFFESLFRANKPTWIFAMAFHGALWLVLIRHTRYFMEMNSLLVFMQPFGKYASFVLMFGLIGLSARRILVDRVRYISAPSDHLMLVLLMAIGASGMMMSFVSHADITLVKGFFQGLMYFDWQPLPGEPILLVHLFLVAFLMIIFPISKLMHAPGVFFSPTRNQVDNPREQRHLSDWARALEKEDKLYRD